MRYVAVGVFALSCAFRVPGLAAFEGAVAAPVHCALAGSSLAMRGGLMAGTQNPSGLQVSAVFSDQPIPKALQRRFTSCGSGNSCKGTGTGCG